MMNFKKLVCNVKESGEEFVLYDGINFQNFDRLREIAGSNYINLNDDLMNGPSPDTWYGNDDPMNPVYTIWGINGPEVTLCFHYEV